MQIITAPHQTLRETAQEIEQLDKKTIQLLNDLRQTLINKQDPPGVGLAGPQVNKKVRAFAIRPVDTRGELADVEIFVNPTIIKHSPEKTLGPEEDQPELEGCLSIPKIYGPVPRYPWVELEYQLFENQKLELKKKRFEQFPARIIQHELDHLNGILFTDYILQYDLPAYLESNGELNELTNRSILEVY